MNYTIGQSVIVPGPDWREQVYAYQRQQQPEEFAARIAGKFVDHVRSVRMANPDIPAEKKLIDMVIDACEFYGIQKIPYTMIADTPVLNAASIMGKSFVFTTGIMQRMPEDQLRAVVGHEMGHHRNSKRDQTVLISTGIATLGAGLLLNNKINALQTWMTGKVNSMLRYPILIASEIALFMAFSIPFTPWRWHMERESDYHGAAFSSPEAMAGALQTLKENHKRHRNTEDSTVGRIIMKVLGFLAMPFGSHPPIESRIQAMRDLAAKRNQVPHSYTYSAAPSTPTEREVDRLFAPGAPPAKVVSGDMTASRLTPEAAALNAAS